VHEQASVPQVQASVPAFDATTTTSA